MRSSSTSARSPEANHTAVTDADPRDHAVVISVVYDGPPEAGKTTSVRALARSAG
jgi:hypothetical protein